MKLRTPFTIINDALCDVKRIHDFNYELPEDRRSGYWQKQCEMKPYQVGCLIYED